MDNEHSNPEPPITSEQRKKLIAAVNEIEQTIAATDPDGTLERINDRVADAFSSLRQIATNIKQVVAEPSDKEIP